MKESFSDLVFSEEASEALASGRPLVALESTIIAHGMPYPDNLSVALRAEEEVRKAGAVPATVAVLGGRFRVGLERKDIEFLATSRGVAKASRRDLPGVLLAGGNASTTVASTMFIAARAGIRVFATGGMGGVHRGATESFDISADLPELARTNIALVSSGVKAILDIGLTLEYLETLGVPVVGYRTDEFPAFYTRESGFRVDLRLDSPAECAKLLALKWRSGLEGGVLIANPVPGEFAMEREAVEAAVEKVVAEAKREGVRGRELTPFLLARIKDVTGGRSLAANAELVFSNARLASAIAKELAATRS